MILYGEQNKIILSDKCAACSNKIDIPYKPMESWKIDGVLCSKCYSEKISKHYPGDHIRVNNDRV
jgi:hypothetical protein